MSGAVVWFTGLPSSGKSTLAGRVAEALRAKGHTAVCMLDGDAVRSVIAPRHGYDPVSRDHFYDTLSGLAAMLAAQGLTVLVPATANLRAFRERARERAPRFIEVYVEVPVGEVTERDAKGLYAAQRAGSVAHMPGADAGYEAPEHPDVVARGGRDDEALSRVVTAVMA